MQSENARRRAGRPPSRPFWPWPWPSAGPGARSRSARAAESVPSRTIALDQVTMQEVKVDGKLVGKNGVYTSGDTPASSKFVTGRFVLNPGQTPHPPHTHVEEEVMVIESGHGEIYCDGKTTKIGPGSVMYTAPRSRTGSPTPATPRSSSITSSGRARTRNDYPLAAGGACTPSAGRASRPEHLVHPSHDVLQDDRRRRNRPRP